MSLNETGHRRRQGGDRPDPRRRRLQPAQVRGRRPSRPARPGDRVERPDPHVDRDRRRDARGRRGRGRDRRGAGPPDRRQALVGARRPVGQHDRLGGADHAPADRPRRRDPGREEPAQEQGQGDVRAALAAATSCELAKQRERRFGARAGSMVGGGDRSEKIRTYNFPQDRVTDHRIGHDLHNLPGVLDGELDALIDALVMADQAERLAAVTERTGIATDGSRRGRPAAPPARQLADDVDPAAIRCFDPVARPIVQATDLGSVQVLKHGNLYLLTDPFGDVHPDSRGLGLYDGDTRLLSCSRAAGQRRCGRCCSRASAGGNYRGTIQLTNPSIDRNPRGQGEPAGRRARGAEAGHRPRRGRCRRGSRGAGPDRQLRRAPGDRSTVELELAVDARRHLRGPRAGARPARRRCHPAAVLRRRAHVPLRRPRRSPALDPPRASRAGRRGRAGRSARDGSDGGAWLRLALDLAARARPATRAALGRVGDARPTPANAGDSPAELFPEPPRIDEARAGGAYHAWTRSTAEVDTDHELFNLTVVALASPTCGCWSTTAPGEGERYLAAGVPWFATLFGRDSRSSLAPGARVPAAARGRDADRARRAPGDRATTSGGTRSRARSCTSCASGEMAATGELPHRPYYGSVDATPLWLDPARRDLRLDGRPRARRPALAERARGARVDRPVRRPRRRRLRRVRAPHRARAAQPGLEGLARRDPRPPRPRGASRRSRWPRSRATSTTPSAGWPTSPASAATRRWRSVSSSDAEQLRERFEDAFWVEDQGYYAMALDGDKRPADAIGSNAGPLPVERDRRRRTGRAGRRPADVARTVLRLGHPHVRRRPARLQPASATTPARSGRTTRR